MIYKHILLEVKSTMLEKNDLWEKIVADSEERFLKKGHNLQLGPTKESGVVVMEKGVLYSELLRKSDSASLVPSAKQRKQNVWSFPLHQRNSLEVPLLKWSKFPFYFKVEHGTKRNSSETRWPITFQQSNFYCLQFTPPIYLYEEEKNECESELEGYRVVVVQGIDWEEWRGSEKRSVNDLGSGKNRCDCDEPQQERGESQSNAFLFSCGCACISEILKLLFRNRNCNTKDKLSENEKWIAQVHKRERMCVLLGSSSSSSRVTGSEVKTVSMLVRSRSSFTSGLKGGSSWRVTSLCQSIDAKNGWLFISLGSLSLLFGSRSRSYKNDERKQDDKGSEWMNE